MNANSFKPAGFGSFKSEKPENSFVDLPQGWQHVKVSRIIPTNDRQTNPTDGEEKDPSNYEWEDRLDQLAITFVGVNGQGVLTHRYSGWGFKLFSEIEQEDPEFAENSCLSAGEKGYAVDTTTGSRIPSEARTKSCMNIMNNLFASCKKQDENGNWIPLPEGSSLDNLIGCQLEVRVDNERWKNKDRFRVGKTRKFSDAQVKAEASTEPTEY